MSNSDVLLHRNQVEVVATDGAGLTVTTREGADPDAVLRPNWATLTLGGGDGESSDGDVELRDREGNTRVHLDGGGNGPADESTTHAFVDGGTATLELGRGTEPDAAGTVELWPGGSGEEAGRPAVEIEGASRDSRPSVVLREVSSDDELVVTPNSIEMFLADIENADLVEATAVETRTLTAGYRFGAEGEFDYEPGEIVVRGDAGFEDDQTETVTIEGAPEGADGGVISVTDDGELTTVEVRGDRGLVKLGASGEPQALPGGGETRLLSNNGQLLVDDGAGALFELTAEAGVVSISDKSAGETLLEIDTGDGRIRTKYPVEEGTL